MKTIWPYYRLAFLLVGYSSTVFLCQWTDWSPCSVTCDKGNQTRHLLCLCEEAVNCTNTTHEIQPCWSSICSRNESCSLLSCQNGGTCETGTSGSYCACQPDFTGLSCETAVADINASIACPPLTNPFKGWVNVVHGITAIARYGCDINYVLTPPGSNTRRCKSIDGIMKWSGKSPTCEETTHNCSDIQCSTRCVYGYIHNTNTSCDVCSCYAGCPSDQYGDVTKCSKCNCSSTQYCDKRDGHCSRYDTIDLTYLRQAEHSTEWQSGDYLWTDLTSTTSYPYTQNQRHETTNTLQTGTTQLTTPEAGKGQDLQIAIIAAAIAGGIAVLFISFAATFCACHKRKHTNVTTSDETRQKCSKPDNPVVVDRSSNTNRESETKPVPPPRPPGHEYMTLIANGDVSSDSHHNYTSLLESTRNLETATNPELTSSDTYQEIEDVMEEKTQLENNFYYIEMSEGDHNYIELESGKVEHGCIERLDSRL